MAQRPRMSEMAASGLIGAAAGLLLVAGAAKLLTPDPSAGLVLLLDTPPELVRGVGAGEILVALSALLLSRRRAAGLLAAAYGLLILASTATWLAGESECGCFGQLTLPPAHTAALDAVAAGLLILVRRTGDRNERCARPWSSPAFRMVFGLVPAVVIGPLMWRDAKDAVALMPGSDVDAVRTFLDEVCGPYQQRFYGGRWLIVVLSRHCRRCRELAPSLEQQSSRRAGISGRTLLVDIGTRCGERAIVPSATGVRGRRKILAAPLPLLLDVEDGRPVSIRPYTSATWKTVYARTGR